jgi:hypothetical protein
VLKVDVPVTICTAQPQARSALCYISLIKSLNLNFADRLNILQLPNLKPKSFTRPFAARTTLLAGAGAAGEQTADHGGGESGEADLLQRIPQQAASARAQALRH